MTDSSMVLITLAYWQQTIIKSVVVLAVLPAASLIFGYVFLFKMMAFMQSRLGPMEAGPYGLLQLLADGAKFIQKEDIVPKNADKIVFALGPAVVLFSTFLLYALLPVGPDLVPHDYSTGIFLALALSSVSVIGVLMSGWSSANKYALMGGLRAAGQLIAYELPMVLAIIGVIIQAETLSLQGIVMAQAEGEIFGFGFFGSPYIITQFIGFAVFLIAIQAETTQPPFDMPVAESEVVGGYFVEYTGFRFLFFQMGEMGTLFAFSAIAAVMFLGGWWVPGFDPESNWLNVLGPAVMFGKVMLVAFLVFWARFTYPRFREDQLQSFAWKYLIPIALANIVLTAVFKVAF